MSDSILVRITLDSYNMASTGQQTRVYVQIPEVARNWWLLPEDAFHRLKDWAWPEVLDAVEGHIAYGDVASNSASTAAWAAIQEWMRNPANRDEMQAAFEEDCARRDPATRKLLAEIAELKALAGTATEYRLMLPPPEYTPLIVRRDPAYDGTRWAVLHDPGDLGVRRVRTQSGWRMAALLHDTEVYCWPDGQTAWSEARWLVGGADGITRVIAPTQALQPEPEAPALTVYRAQWDSIPLDFYTTPDAARAHCETHARRDLPDAAFDWVTDPDDGVAELVATVDGEQGPTGYEVTPLEIASEYDEEADE
ncbi:hypothetical protein [Streptomyces sp. 4F14]|uniref:hypothetical protein n=1 Tax=Streptomyces sp. 4F14 TaxID=3394380 RepID=UPI003A886C41